MSSWLSTDTRIEYVPLLYDGQDVLVNEGNGCDYEEEAECDGADMVARYVREHHEYCYCVIQKRVVPIWES